MKIPGMAAVFMLVSMLACGAALAHKVNLFAYVEAGEVHTESYFPDGRAVAGGRVSVIGSLAR